MKKNLLISAFLITIVLIAGYFTLHKRSTNPSQQSSTTQHLYQSEKYGFSFTTPERDDIHEYTPAIIAVGHNADPDAFDASAEVHVITSSTDTTYKNFDEFVVESMKNACAADGPSETIYCDKVIQPQPFESASGLSGEVMYLNRVHENLQTKKAAQDAFGPIFVFNIQANVPGATYAALIVRPPANLAATAVDSTLVRSIADSVRINTVE